MTRPSLGGAADSGIGKLVKMIEGLQKQISELRPARNLNAATIDEGGIQIINGGTIKVIDADGHTVALVGALPPQYNRSDGSPQPGFVLYREDGSTAAFMGDLNATTPPYRQALQLMDRTGRIVIADDTNSGQGLANPHLDSGGMENTNVATWPATNSTSFITIANKFMEIQNPTLTWQIQMYCDPGISAQYKLLVAGSQVGTTQSVSANSFATWSTFSALPAGVSVGDVPLIELQAKTSATSASARAVCLRIAGTQT